MGFELFERAAGARAQLLRVQRLGEAGGEASAAGFVLTFDVGRILVAADPRTRSLKVEPFEDEAAGLAMAAEEEPWWRVIGNPIVAAREVLASESIGLQFRPDDENPRVIALFLDDGLVRAAVER